MPVSFLNFLDITTYANAAALTAISTATLPNGMYAAVTNLGVFKLNKQSSSTVDGSTVIASDSSTVTWDITYNMHILEDASAVIDDSQLGAFSSILLGNGTAAAPSLAFSSDLTTGLYRAAASTIGFTGAGAMLSTLSPTAFVLNTGIQVSAPTGTASAPTYSFTGNLNCGMYNISTGFIGFACGGTLRVTMSSSGITMGTGVQVILPAATVANPAIIFGGEQTGLYLISAGVLGMATAGSSKVSLSSAMFSLTAGTVYGYAGIQVVAARNTGWTTAVGSILKDLSGINTDAVTATDADVRYLARWLKGLTDAFITHGLIGA